MVLQLKRLEKVLEQSLSDGKDEQLESTVDTFLNENGDISEVNSSRLHDTLFRIWAGLPPDRPTMELDSEYALSPATSTVEVQPLAPHGEPGKSANPRVLFLNTLIRLAPCLIIKDQLQEWWRELAPYAIDSTGHPLDLVDRAQTFISGVLTSSFYIYSDPSLADHFADIAALYGQNVLDIYVEKWFPAGSVNGEKPAQITDERRRFIMLHCRTMFGKFARKDNKTAFTQINRYFVQPQYRLDMLDLVVEYLSESQNSKLFKIYESPFFESLLVCLERDYSRIVLQLAITALSMLLVHVCDKLVSTNALFRVYGIFGRACSWQPKAFNEGDIDYETNDETNDESDGENGVHDTSIQEGGKPIPDQDEEKGKASPDEVSASHDNAKALPDQWVPVDIEDDTSIAADGEIDVEVSVKVISLFTFLYGLFPINTLNFCKQCDDYFKKHNYQRRFSDYWSRFMVTRKAERLVRQFRVDPLLVLGSEETELSGSVERFQEVGNVMGLSSICTSRRIIQVFDDEEEHIDAGYVTEIKAKRMDADEVSKNHLFSATERVTRSRTNSGRTHEESIQGLRPSEHDQHIARAQSVPNFHSNGKHTIRKERFQATFDQHLSEHRHAFEMHALNSVGHWHRELLLIRTELAFANFSRDMSEQRALRWQKRASDRMILLTKNESLTRENVTLRGRVIALDNEVSRTIRSARNMMRERSAYESKILERNREYRDKVKDLEEQLLDYSAQTESAKAVSAIAEQRALEAHNDFVKSDEQVRLLKNNLETASRPSPLSDSSGEADSQLTGQINLKQKEIEELKEQVSALKWSMKQLEQSQTEELLKSRREVEESQANYVRIKDEASRKLRARREESTASATAQAEEKDYRRQLKLQNEELIRRCMALEHELRARKVHEEERLNELQAALLSSRSYSSQASSSENRFRGRGGAQGVPHWK